MKTDLEIARDAELRPIVDVAADMGVPEEFVEPRGHGIAKIKLEALDAMGPPRAKYVLVTAMNPTPLVRGRQRSPSVWHRDSSCSTSRRS
jgi:formate--tetrahydrofolate ligase